MRAHLLAAALVAAVAIACSAPPIPDDTPVRATGADPKPPPPARETKSAELLVEGAEGELYADAGADDASPGAGVCAAERERDDCFECCDEAHPAALAALRKAYASCVCAADACGGACAKSACAGERPAQGDACDDCLREHGRTCERKAYRACPDEPACAPLVACDRASECEGKPS